MRPAAPPCEGWQAQCALPAEWFNAYCYTRDDDNYIAYFCESCASSAQTAQGLELPLDYYLPILLADVGDELWIALECAWITLAGLV